MRSAGRADPTALPARSCETQPGPTHSARSRAAKAETEPMRRSISLILSHEYRQPRDLAASNPLKPGDDYPVMRRRLIPAVPAPLNEFSSDQASTEKLLGAFLG
jgi:hypothetical protein